MKQIVQGTQTWLGRILATVSRKLSGYDSIHSNRESRAGNEKPGEIGAYGMLSDMSHYKRPER